MSEPTVFVSAVGVAPKNINTTTHMCSTVDASLLARPNLDQFWNLESIGITESPSSYDDDKALESFNQTVKFTGGRYMVTWPWKEKPPDLPQNCTWLPGPGKRNPQTCHRITNWLLHDVD